MKKIFFSLMMIAALALTACASPTGVGTTQPPSSDQVATIVAATMQAFLSSTASAPPVAPTQVPAVSASTGQSALIAFVKDGNIQVWNEATNQTKTIFASGDATTVTASDDGQVIAFSRRSSFDQPNIWEQFALWTVDRDGKNPREVVSAESVRKRINPNEGDSTGFAELKWIPGTHRILYTIGKYFLPGQGAIFSSDIYLVDADTLSDSVLVSGVVPADEFSSSVKIVPSPDGSQLALITKVELSFINADGSNWRRSALTYSAVGAGDAGPVMPVGVWTQDSSAFVITGSMEMDAGHNIRFAIWRVPADGSSSEQLATASLSHPASVTFSPDGKHFAHIQYNDQQPGPIGWFIDDLHGIVGPLAIPHDYDSGSYANLNWSPAGKVYTINFMGLCPNATQDTDVCDQPFIDFSGDIAAIHWIDGNRFLFVTATPPVLFFGKLDGTAIPIVAWSQSNKETSRSFAPLALR